MFQMANVYYQGHGSLRFQTNGGTVIYLDPYAGDGYDLPADVVLITHEHHDHNELSLITEKPDCQVIRSRQAQQDGAYRRFKVKDVSVEAVPAYNAKHSADECVGYLLRFDGLCIYCAGDTSKTLWMKNAGGLNIDYAFLPTDGIYNMGPEEASECAGMIKAKHSVPVHMKPGALFDRTAAETFHGVNRLILEPGKETEL